MLSFVLLGLDALSCGEQHTRSDAPAAKETEPAGVPPPDPRPVGEPAADAAAYGAFLDERFQLDAISASAQQHARIERILTRAARRCMAPRWVEWVCPGNLELEIIVLPGKPPAAHLRAAGENRVPEDAALHRCFEEMLQPLRTVGLEQRAQLVFPIAVKEGFRDKQVSGCGDDPSFGLRDFRPLPPPMAKSPVVERAARDAVSKELIRRHIHQAIEHCRQSDPAGWISAGVVQIEYWIDSTSASRSNRRTDRPVILLTRDELGAAEVSGPALECMTEQAQPLIALAKQHRTPLRVTFPVFYGPHP